MTFTVHCNNLCIPLNKEFLISTYDGNKKIWDNAQKIQCNESMSSEDFSVQCCSFSSCGRYLAVCLSKNLIIYNNINWNLFCTIKTDRKGVSVKFFPKSNIILFAEKSGNIKFFEFYEGVMKRIDLNLGHNSMLIEALVTEDEKFIITCDRDEKIRITNYPNTYNIQCYCFGHKQLVTSMDFLQSDKNVLISSSADNTIRFWKITTGEELSKYTKPNIPINSTCFFIKVTSFQIDKDQSLVAAQEYKSNNVTLLKVLGDLIDGISVNLLTAVQCAASPWDIAFWQGNILSIIPDKEAPLKLYPSNICDNVNSSCIKNLSQTLIENWDLLQKTYNNKADALELLFQLKKDIVNDYEKIKKSKYC